nr:hypothetical protein LSAT_6X39981 [Tanacetum cinerariifolium]
NYHYLLNQLESYTNTTNSTLDLLWKYTFPIYHEDQQNRYSKPMPWIGIYIASASLVCILAMAADSLHGLRNRKLWFPCNYFTLNAASLSVICSTLTIINSKHILELKYQAGHERALSDLKLKRPRSVTTKKLKQYIGYYWVMAETESPQFMTACSATTSASENNSIPLPLRSHKCKVALENLKVLILSFSIGFQKTVVVTYTDISQYVLQLQNDMEPAERTLKGILKSMNCLIQRAKKQQPKNLIKLLQKSIGFEGVENFGRHHVPTLSTEYPNCWSLPLRSLTTIAISLPNIQNDIVDSLLRSVSEGLLYVSLVEGSFNATHECVTIQKAVKMLWLDVEVHHKWLGNKLKDLSPQVNTTRNILEWFRDTAKHVTGVESVDIEDLDNNSVCKSVCANSIYSITQTILLFYQDTSTAELSQEVLFARLSSMISGILAACLTNLPQVIAMKYHTSFIEKREASVYATAQLLCETTQIINNLQDRELPSLNPDELPFINKWCDYFRDQFP